MRPQPACPECEKLAAIADNSNPIGAFLDWLESTQQIVLCRWEDNDDEDTNDYLPHLLMPTEFRGSNGINKLLALYFNIDLDKVEQERRALLEWLQERHENH